MREMVGQMMRDGMTSDTMARWMDGPFGIPLAPLAILLIVVAVVLLARLLAGGSTSGRKADGALDALRERYARGEIDREEFEERRRTLQA